ncbi:PAS domain S-box protein [Cohnella pontilimi]|uniref:PAS domain S-box protein n=1 Tax=Cohnella pontilimi TaxID=2564100 RepID=UPI00145C4A4C|nr:PAS domain S-box protein [Cohnella pontilimi]
MINEIFDRLGVAVWSFDFSTNKFEHFTEAFASITGYPTRLFPHLSSWKRIIHPEDADLFEIWLAVIRHGIVQETELRIIDANEQIRWVLIRVNVSKNESGTVMGFDGVITDISPRKKAEEELSRGERKYALTQTQYQLIAENTKDLLAIIDISGGLLYASPSHNKVLGHDCGAEAGTSCLDYVHPDDRNKAFQAITDVAHTGTSRQLQLRMVHANGHSIHIDFLGTPVTDDQGKVESLVFVGRDITEEVRVRTKLLESEKRFRRLIELSPQPMIAQRAGKISFINPAGLKLLGASDGSELIGESIYSIVHPDYQRVAENRIAKIFTERFEGSLEYRLVRLDGQIIVAEVASIYDEETETILLVLHDITERKKAEFALKESEEMNRRLVEMSPEAIILHNGRQYIFANPAAHALLGAQGEIAGLSVFENIHPDFAQQAAVRFQKVHDESCTSPFIEQKIVRFDAGIVDVEVISAPISYQGGNACITVMRDITERKKAEERRKEAEQALQDSQDRYYRLQSSLDRFSSDLFGVLKIQELESRLVKEVQKVIKATNVSIIELERTNRFYVRAGQHAFECKERSLFAWSEMYPVCTLVDTSNGHFLKLGHFRGKVYLLCIGETPPMLAVQPKRVWLETISRYVSVLYDNFRVIEDLTKELEEITSSQSAPSWLLRILFKISEHERKRLSQDLHDAALQEQIIWYRKLDQLSADSAFPDHFREPLKEIIEGLLNVIYQIRITCNELRPPMLMQEGLVSSLESLFEFTQIRSNYITQFDASDFHTLLSDDQVIGLYRIVQELLSNATKHSSATEVRISLMSHSDCIELNYEDNGVGMQISRSEGTFKSMGVYSMKERVRSLGGKMEMHSSPKHGLKVYIFLPVSPESRTLDA